MEKIYCASNGRIITVSRNLSVALVGELVSGYHVTLHDMPRHPMEVDAATMDEAITLAHCVAERETGRKLSNAATTHRISE